MTQKCKTIDTVISVCYIEFQGLHILHSIQSAYDIQNSSFSYFYSIEFCVFFFRKFLLHFFVLTTRPLHCERDDFVLQKDSKCKCKQCARPSQSHWNLLHSNWLIVIGIGYVIINNNNKKMQYYQIMWYIFIWSNQHIYTVSIYISALLLFRKLNYAYILIC